MIGALIVIASSVGWAGFDATRKALATAIEPLPLAAAVIIAQAPLFLCWFLIQSDPFAFSAVYLKPAIASSLLNIVANYLFLRALRVSPLSLTIPFLAFTPVFAALIEWAWLGDSPSGTQWVGVLTVVGGAFGLQLSSHDGSKSFLRAMTEEKGSLYVIVVALIWSMTSIFDKLAVRNAPEAAHGLWQTLTVGAGLMLATIAMGKQREWKKLANHKLVFGGAIVAALAALSFQLLAYAHVLVSTVEATKRAVGVTAAIFLGHFLFNEELNVRKVVACGVLYAGVALILFTGSPQA